MDLINKKMIFTVLGIIVAGAIGVSGYFFYQSQALAAPVAEAVCEDGYIIITMEPTPQHATWAIRIDDKKNSWNQNELAQGDISVDNYKRNTFEQKATFGGSYNWWVHSVTEKGKWSALTGGPVVCSIEKPVETKSVYQAPVMTLTWKPVPGAVKYAIRIDNTENPFSPEDPQKGDVLSDKVTTNAFQFNAEPGKTYIWWVHAIDKNGVWSSMSTWTKAESR